MFLLPPCQRNVLPEKKHRLRWDDEVPLTVLTAKAPNQVRDRTGFGFYQNFASLTVMTGQSFC
ncbi:MAG TPA: hypothetical protein DCE76_08740 [Anaerolineaceae bacterium]|nr:hypothetical protein [Anaerolineaceae bacterium]